MPKTSGLAALIAVLLPLCALSQTSGQAHHPAAHAARPSAPALPPVPLPSEPGSYAVLYTSMGNIVCRLFPQDAPKAVGNFTALASGTKAWTDPATGQTKHTPLYSGTVFHRVIPDFMIQGGDPIGTGTGDPGYKFEDEVSSGKVFDHPGILAMANSGPNTNGSQFFITVAPTPWLNGKHTIFGEVVTGQDIADAISKVPRDADDKPSTTVKLIRVVIKKVAAPKATAAPSPQPPKP